jgi:hypothetical protein
MLVKGFSPAAGQKTAGLKETKNGYDFRSYPAARINHKLELSSASHRNWNDGTFHYSMRLNKKMVVKNIVIPINCRNSDTLTQLPP